MVEYLDFYQKGIGFAPYKGIRIPESATFFLLEFGSWPLESGIPLTFETQNPCSTDKDLESSNWNPESTA